jgi:hypothetical protein
MPISTISQWGEAYCCYKLQNRFPARNVGKLSAINVSGISAISFCGGCPRDKNEPRIFALSKESSFCQEQVSFKLKNKISVV